MEFACGLDNAKDLQKLSIAKKFIKFAFKKHSKKCDFSQKKISMKILVRNSKKL